MQEYDIDQATTLATQDKCSKPREITQDKVQELIRRTSAGESAWAYLSFLRKQCGTFGKGI
jgi:hypothetical protein